MNHLRSCVACQRHIRITESACPFCGAAVAAERRTPPPLGNPSRRLRRAAALATAATVGSVAPLAQVVACGSSSGGPVITAADAYGAYADVFPEPDVPDVSTSMDAGPDGDVIAPGPDAEAGALETGSGEASTDGETDGPSVD